MPLRAITHQFCSKILCINGVSISLHVSSTVPRGFFAGVAMSLSCAQVHRRLGLQRPRRAGPLPLARRTGRPEYHVETCGLEEEQNNNARTRELTKKSNGN